MYCAQWSDKKPKEFFVLFFFKFRQLIKLKERKAQSILVQAKMYIKFEDLRISWLC